MAVRILLSRTSGYKDIFSLNQLQAVSQNLRTAQKSFSYVKQNVTVLGRSNLKLFHCVQQCNIRPFHTSSRSYVNPLLVLFGKQAAKLVSMIGGRFVIRIM